MEKTNQNNIRRLEKGLLRSLVDPQDSLQRQRYVKKWIYGETVTQSDPEKDSYISETDRSIWGILQRIITGED